MQILKNHVVPVRLSTAQLKNQTTSLSTLQGQSLKVKSLTP